MTDRPPTGHADVTSKNREHRQHNHHRQKPRHDQKPHRIDRHDFQSFNFLPDFHRAKFRRNGRPAATDDDDTHQQGTELAENGHSDEIRHVGRGAQACEFLRPLHGKGQADAQRGEGCHWKRLHADADHLLEHCGEPDRLAPERAEEKPVENLPVQREKCPEVHQQAHFFAASAPAASSAVPLITNSSFSRTRSKIVRTFF